MWRFVVINFFWLLCLPANAQDREEREKPKASPTDSSVGLPVLVNQLKYPRNWQGNELDAQLCAFGNWDVLLQLVERKSTADRALMIRRMADLDLSWDVRALYAAVLACQEQKAGHDFLLAASKDIRSQRLGDVFWLIGHLSDFLPRTDDAAHPNAMAIRSNKPIGTIKFVPVVDQSQQMRPSLEWAIPLMLEALTDTRKCAQKITWEDVCSKEKGIEPRYPTDSIRTWAIHYGGFHRLLAQLHNEKAVPILCDLVLTTTPESDVAAPGLPLLAGLASHEMLELLQGWDTPLVESTLLDAAQRAEKRQYGARTVAIVLPWFMERKKTEAIPLILNNLEEEEIYSSVVGTKHTPYLEALSKKLLELGDGNESGLALQRRRRARHHAELILIVGRESDPVPKLMQFAADPQNEHERHFAIYCLHDRNDSRIAPWAMDVMRREQNWFVPHTLIELLANSPSLEATHALIELLNWDFHTVKREKNVYGTAKDYRDHIAEKLRERTGQELGTNPTLWREWLMNQPSK